MLPRHPNVIWELLAADARVRQPDRRWPPPAAGDGQGDGARQGSAADDPRDRRDRRGRQSARTLYDRRRRSCVLGEDGRVSLPGTPYLAGSSLTLDRAIANTVRFTGLADRRGDSDGLDDPRAYLGMTTGGHGAPRTGMPDDARAARRCASDHMNIAHARLGGHRRLPRHHHGDRADRRATACARPASTSSAGAGSARG